MKLKIIFIVLLGSIACQNKTDHKQIVLVKNNSTNTTKTVQYAEKELVSLLDSIGGLNPNGWTEKLTFIVDSILLNQIKLNYKVIATDFKELKSATEIGEINLSLAKRIFPQLEIDHNLASNLENNKLPLILYSFDNNPKTFNEFAILIAYDGGLSWNNDIYFFKADKIIAKHKIFHRYGLELKHFKNELNETTIYYKVNYESGTGVWWNQFNFYRYDYNELLPTLTEIENINLQYSWGMREYWIESTILDTKPLKLKFVFNNQFTDSLGNQINFIKDSTEIVYKFDTKKKIYEPDFVDSKLNKLKLLTYFHADNELLFVNVNYDLFEKELNSNEEVKREAILKYLNELKNTLDKR